MHLHYEHIVNKMTDLSIAAIFGLRDRGEIIHWSKGEFWASTVWA